MAPGCATQPFFKRGIQTSILSEPSIRRLAAPDVPYLSSCLTSSPSIE
jgi:hypothetical protein